MKRFLLGSVVAVAVAVTAPAWAAPGGGGAGAQQPQPSAAPAPAPQRPTASGTEQPPSTPASPPLRATAGSTCSTKRVDACGCHHQYGLRHCHPKLKSSRCEAPVRAELPWSQLAPAPLSL
jgi:hypothetical protein